VFDYLHNVQTPRYIRCVCDDNALRARARACIVYKDTHTRTEAASAYARKCNELLRDLRSSCFKIEIDITLVNAIFLFLYLSYDERLVAIHSRFHYYEWHIEDKFALPWDLSAKSTVLYRFQGKICIPEYYLYTLIHLNDILRYDSLIGIYLSSQDSSLTFSSFFFFFSSFYLLFRFTLDL